MKRKTIEKQLKAIAKKESLQIESKQANSKAKAKKLLKKDFESLQKQKQAKEILQAKESLKESKQKKAWLELKEKSKLEKFNWLFASENYLKSQFAFSEKDFFIHWIEILKSEKEKKLLYIYNKIESIWKGLNLNEIEKIILENLKKRLIIEYCNNFEKNLKAKNLKDIKDLNLYFANSNLKKYIANVKEKESLNIFESEKENIFWKSSNNFESNYIEKINWKYILHQIWKLEKEKAKESLKEKKNWKKLNWKERKAILKEKSKLEKVKAILNEKESLKSEYNLKSKQIENSINWNPYLIKASKQIERICKKAFERNWIELKAKELKKEIATKENILKEIEIWNIELTWIENLQILESLQAKEKELKEIENQKKEIEKKVFWIYKSKIEKIINHWKASKDFEYKRYIASIKNCNWKLAYLQKYFESEYWIYLKD